MESNKLGQWMDSLRDALADQPWFQSLKAKWDELDPQSRTYLKLASAGGALVLTVAVAGSFVWNVSKLKRELAEKNELLGMIQSANDEMRRLKESNASVGMAASAAEPWPPYFTGLAASAGIAKESLTLSEEKKGAGSEQVKESLIDIGVKHANIRQITRLAFSLENGARPVKLRNLLIDTKDDPAGYMDATLSVSAFTLSSAGK